MTWLNDVWQFITEHFFIIELVLSAIMIFMLKRKNPTAADQAQKELKATNKKLYNELLAAFKADLNVATSTKETLSDEENKRCAAILAFQEAHKEAINEVPKQK